MRATTSLLSLLCVVAVAAPAAGLPVHWPVSEGGNGHAYDVVTIMEGITWDEARVMAGNMWYEGVRGHLATITSSEENGFVWASHGQAVSYCWIGGSQLPGPYAADEGWVWVTGEPWSFTHWSAGEPNDSSANPDGHEDCLQIGRSGDAAGWNDLWPSARVPGFVVEFDLDQVPVPATSVGAVKSRY